MKEDKDKDMLIRCGGCTMLAIWGEHISVSSCEQHFLSKTAILSWFTKLVEYDMMDGMHSLERESLR